MINKILKLRYLFTRKEKIYLLLLLFGLIIGSLLEIIGLGAIPLLVMSISDPSKIFNNEVAGPILHQLGINSQYDLLFVGAGFLIGVILIKNAYLVFLQYFKLKFVFSKQVSLSTRLFKNYLNADYTFHLNKNSAELLRNTHAECNAIIQQVLLPFLTIIMELFMALSILSVLIFVEPLISLSTFGFIVLTSMVFLLFTQKKLSNYGSIEVTLRKEKNKNALQSFNAIKEIIVLGRKDFFISEFTSLAEHSSIALRYKNFISSSLKPFIETVAISGIFVIIILMIFLGREINDIIPLLALFGAAAIRFMPIFNSIGNNYNMLKFGIHSVDPVVDDIIDLENKQKTRKKNTSEEIIHLNNSIVFKDLNFCYPETNKKALKNINFEIQKGQIIGLVGSSGAGKTTLVDLLLGVLKPTEGQILVDGKNTWSNIKSWQQKIGYVPQTIKLMDDTVANNIALGIPEKEVDLSRVVEVSKMANLHDFIETLDRKYETVIGENGVMLSGGQRQRIGIARALYHDPEVLVLDEATSALDNVTEKIITEAINKLRKQLTIVVIAHRLTTIKDSDRIYFLKNGKIKAFGTYHELIEKDTEFHKMSLVD